MLAVGLGFIGFLAALVLQFSMRRYIAWTYWLAVVMVGVFGTMAADVLHVGFGVPYAVSSTLYAVVLVAVFVTWQMTEKTLSIHSIDTPRRELSTGRRWWRPSPWDRRRGPDGDNLRSGLPDLRPALCRGDRRPAFGYWRFGWNAVFSFWFAYVVTRPLGASFADWMGKPQNDGGLGWGDGTVALALTIAIFCLVAYLAITRADVQRAERAPRAGVPAPAPIAELAPDEID